ncbi:hypothetical protein NLM16_38525 [Bradyrhizobium brasilense]|uniref:hypothetical protein n=1 Tax=Bradyrhizobium brasilense TaxID=1419277 RepID=UPI0028773620|nr:hypothetical protein [Bradyrhizobium brasilense]MCP3420008.1 hypothetical protein [Bradyrhizobium brasilense]
MSTKLDDTGLRLDLLRGRFWAHGGERLDFAALEANMNFGGSFRRHLDEGDIFDDVSEQPFAFTIRRVWICPKLVEVDRHRGQPLANSFIEDELILLPRGCITRTNCRAASEESAFSVEVQAARGRRLPLAEDRGWRDAFVGGGIVGAARRA